MSREILCVMVYDVPDDKRRTRLHKLLKQFGRPFQYSVFEARLTARERQQVAREVAALLDGKIDSFVIYPVASDQERGIRVIGRCRPPVEAPSFFLV